MEQKCLGLELFYKNSKSFTYEQLQNSSETQSKSNEGSYCNKNSSNEFIWQNELNKLYKSMTVYNFDRAR